MDLHGNRSDYLAEPRHLKVLDFPYFEHQRSIFFADEPHLPAFKIDSIEVMIGQRFSDRIVLEREQKNEVKQVRKISPQDFLFERAKSKRVRTPLLRGSSHLISSNLLPV